MGHNASNYRDCALALMPNGPAWNKSTDSKIGKFWSAIGTLLSMVEYDAEKLEKETHISNVDQLLPEWEDDLGLPDPWNIYDIPARRAALFAKYKKKLLQTPQFLESYAAALGYDLIVVNVHRPFICGSEDSQCGDAMHEVGVVMNEFGIQAIHTEGVVSPEYFKSEMEKVISAHVAVDIVA